LDFNILHAKIVIAGRQSGVIAVDAGTAVKIGTNRDIFWA
jgi:hypothetical protein